MQQPMQRTMQKVIEGQKIVEAARVIEYERPRMIPGRYIGTAQTQAREVCISSSLWGACMSAHTNTHDVHRHVRTCALDAVWTDQICKVMHAQVNKSVCMDAVQV